LYNKNRYYFYFFKKSEKNVLNFAKYAKLIKQKLFLVNCTFFIDFYYHFRINLFIYYLHNTTFDMIGWCTFIKKMETRILLILKRF